MNTKIQWWEIEGNYQEFEVEADDMLIKLLVQLGQITKGDTATGSGIVVEAGGMKWSFFMEEINFTDGLNVNGCVVPSYNDKARKEAWMNIDHPHAVTVTLRIRNTL